MELRNKSDTILVSFNYTQGDIPVLIVGRQGTKKDIDIINAIKGKEAEDLYKKIIGGRDIWAIFERKN